MKNNKKICHDAHLFANLHASSAICVCLTILLALLTASAAQGQGHGLCNNSGGFRSIKQALATDPEVLSEFPDILRKIESDEMLSEEEYVFFSLKYTQEGIAKAEVIAKNTIGDAFSANSTSHPTLLTRNNALAMDIIMSEGINPERAVALSRSSMDADIDIISLTKQGNYGADLRTIKNLVERDITDLRFNDNEIPSDIRALLKDSSFENASIAEILEALTPEQLESIPSTKTLTQTAAQLKALNVGDTALISYNTEIILETSGAIVPPLRSTVFVQRFSPDFFIFYDPLLARAALFKVPVTFIEQSELANELFNIINTNQFSVFSKYVDQLRNAGREAFPFAVEDMQFIYELATYDFPKDILFADFNIITHGPPPAP